MNQNTILVTAIGSFSASTVIEALKDDGYHVIGCDIYPAEWVANSQFVDVFYQAPYATNRPAYEEFVRMICREEGVDFIMPLTDVEIDLFRGWTAVEEETGAVVCMSDRKSLEICRNKKAQELYLEPLGVCNTIPGRFLAEVVDEIETLEYPVVLKPVDGRSSQGLRMANSLKEMEYAVHCCQGEFERYLVQPKISGPIITVDVVRDPETGDTVCVPRRELLRTANGAGLSVYVFRNMYLEEQCRAIAEALNICGCVNLEFVEESAPEEHGGPGVWRFLECNPRFAGGLGFTAAAGYNMVRNHLNCFKGIALEPEGEIREMHITRRYAEYVMD